MERASFPSKPVLRVRWRDPADGQEHSISFDDDGDGRDKAENCRKFLLQTGAKDVRFAREHQSWARG